MVVSRFLDRFTISFFKGNVFCLDFFRLLGYVFRGRVDFLELFYEAGRYIMGEFKNWFLVGLEVFGY